jgi:nickel transport protein
MYRKISSIALSLTLLSLGSASAQAHGIWFAQRGGQLALVYGLGADDLDAVKRIPNMSNVQAFDAGFEPIGAAVRAAGPVVVVDVDAPAAVVGAVLEGGVFSRKKDGDWERGGRDVMPDAHTAERTIKYAVTIQGPYEKAIPALPGQTLQIVPVDPLPANAGGRMTFRVLFQGKPVGGARLINDLVNDPDAEQVETAADGSVALAVRNQGLNVLRAVFYGPSDDTKKYDRIEHTTTLAFTLAHKPE